MYHWVPFYPFHILLFDLLPSSLPFNASVSLGSPGLGLTHRARWRPMGPAGQSEPGNEGTHASAGSLVQPCPLPAFGEPGARAQMEATFHLWQ